MAKKILMALLNPLYRKLTNAHLSCSKEAAHSLFTKIDDVIIIKNGIDVEKFKFNEEIRNEYRKKMNLDGKVVYGHAGRFHKQKNHDFLIDVFYEIQKKQDAVLLLSGTGELENSIREKVKALNIEDKVIFLGFRKDVNCLLNVMDVFLLPSVYEGLPLCAIEAQTSGLPTVVSKAIPEEANISDSFCRIDNFYTERWVEKILGIKSVDRSKAFMNTINAGFDIADTTCALKRIYTHLV